MTHIEHDPHVEAPELDKQEGDTSQGAAWSRPRLKRLQLSLDTAMSPGSANDGFTAATPI